MLLPVSAGAPAGVTTATPPDSVRCREARGGARRHRRSGPSGRGDLQLLKMTRVSTLVRGTTTDRTSVAIDSLNS